MIATKTVAKILQRGYQKRRVQGKRINWMLLASDVRTAIKNSLNKKKQSTASVTRLRSVS